MEVVLIDPKVLKKLKERTALRGSKKRVARAAGVDHGTLNRVIERGRANEDVAERLTKYAASI